VASLLPQREIRLEHRIMTVYELLNFVSQSVAHGACLVVDLPDVIR
jgi:hypothetical protein